MDSNIEIIDDEILDREALVLTYPHIIFSNVTSDLHLFPFMKQGNNMSTAVNSYAHKRGSVVETGPFLLNHMSVANLLYLNIGVTLYNDPEHFITFETTDDLIKIATIKSQR